MAEQDFTFTLLITQIDSDMPTAEVCQECAKPTLGLSVSDVNEGAQRLYRRLGFLPHAFGHEGYTQYVAVLPLKAQPEAA